MKRLMMVVGGCLLAAGMAQAESVEDYYDTSDHLVQSFPIGLVRTVDYAPTAEEIAAADAAIDAAGGVGPKLAPPLAVRNADGTLTIIRGVDNGDDAGLSFWGKERLADAWWVTPHVPAKHHFFRVTDRLEELVW